MKIILLKPTKFGPFNFKKGAKLEVTTKKGAELIASKRAETSDHITLRETHVESKIEDEAEEEFIALPTGFRERAIALETCSNMIVLTKSLEDTRETVKLAAEKRIKQLES